MQTQPEPARAEAPSPTACPECGCTSTQYVGLDDITGEVRRQCDECGDVFYPSDTAAPRPGDGDTAGE